MAAVKVGDKVEFKDVGLTNIGVETMFKGAGIVVDLNPVTVRLAKPCAGVGAGERYRLSRMAEIKVKNECVRNGVGDSFYVGQMVKAADRLTAVLPSYQGKALGFGPHKVVRSGRDGYSQLEGFGDVWIDNKYLTAVNAYGNFWDMKNKPIFVTREDLSKSGYSSIDALLEKFPGGSASSVGGGWALFLDRDTYNRWVKDGKKTPTIKFRDTAFANSARACNGCASRDKVVNSALEYVRKTKKSVSNADMNRKTAHNDNDVDYKALGRDLASAIRSAGFKTEFDTTCAAILAYKPDKSMPTDAEDGKLKAAVRQVMSRHKSGVREIGAPRERDPYYWIPFSSQMYIGGAKTGI